MLCKFRRSQLIALTIIALLTLLNIVVSANTISLLDGSVSVSDTANTLSNSSGVLTATAKGGLLSKGTNTITITNNSGEKAKISFEYTVTSANSFTIDGSSVATKGSYSKEVDGGETIVLVIQSKSGLSDLTVTLKMSSFSCEAIADSSTVTFEFDSALGSVTVDGETIASGTQKKDVAYGTSLSISASPKSGVTFLGWVDTTNLNYRESKNASFGYSPQKDTTLKAVFINTASVPWFLVSNSYLLDDLNEAAALASTKIDKTVALMNTATLPAGGYTIPSGVTLVIPFDAANTNYTTKPASTGTTYTKPTVYRKLTMASGAHITVYGALSLPTKYKSGSGGASDTGSPSGPCSMIYMESDSSITLESGGSLYAYGFITGSSDALVKAKNGSKVYEYFQFMDWRGGEQFISMDNKVCPLSQFYLQNIEVPLEIHSGAVESAYSSVTVTLLGEQGASVPVIGTSNDVLFKIASGYIIKKYDGATDRLEIHIYGDIQVQSMIVKLGIYSVNSKSYVLGLNNNITIHVHGGSNISINNDMAFIPGNKIIVEETATVSIASGKSIYVYDADQWGNFTFGTDRSTKKSSINQPFIALQYAPGKSYTRTTADLVDAEFVINGTFDLSGAYLYTTSGKANINSTGSGEIILGTIGTATVTYQFVQGTGYTEIPITPAFLKNADGTYVQTAAHGADTYVYINGYWHLDSCDGAFSIVESPATCTDAGKRANACACYHASSCECHYTIVEETPALGHNYSEEVTSEPTCTEEGVLTFTCTVCGDSYEEVIDALGHSAVTDAAVAPTCTETGLTEGSHCSVCGEILVAQETVDALGHTEVIDAAVDATCTETGLTEGSHCSVCGEILVAQSKVPALGHSYDSVVTEPTCTEAGYTTHTCSTCGDSYTDDKVAAKGHDYKSVVTEPTCTEAGYTTYTCTCGESYISDEVAATGHSYGGWVVDGDTKTSTCGGCGEIAKRLVGEMNHLYSVQDVLYYNGSFDYSKDAKEIVFKDPQGNVLDTILCVQDSSGVIYLTYAMPSNVILDVVEFVIWIDGVQTDVFEINFDSYADTQTGTNYEKVAQAIVDYGNASSTYFGKNEISEITAKYTSEPESGMSIKSNATESTSLDTYGASFVFDEYIAIKIYLSGNYTFKDGYTYQVGVLFGDETTSELNVNSIGNLCNAYVLYNTLEDVEISASDWVSPISAASADISKVPVLAGKPGVQINLESVEYSKRFAIRAYLIECKADGDPNVYYGRQVNYGLEDYVYSMYNRTDEVLKTSYKVDNPKAFKQFLIETWNYAVAAEQTEWAE